MVEWSDIFGFIDDIKSALWGWVDDIAKYWVQRAHYWYNILNHTWDDVLDVGEKAKAYAEWILGDVWREFNLVWERIGAIPVITQEVVLGWVNPLIEQAKEYAENFINDALKIVDVIITDIWKDIYGIWDKVDDIIEVKIPDLDNLIHSALDWINGADDWIGRKIDEFQDRITGWVEDRFITIIEHVLEMDIKK